MGFLNRSYCIYYPHFKALIGLIVSLVRITIMPKSLIDRYEDTYLAHIEYLAELSSMKGLSEEYVSDMVGVIEDSDDKHNRVKELISILEAS